MKKLRVSLLTAICLIFLLSASLPAWAATAKFWRFPATLSVDGSAFKMEAEANVSDQGINVEAVSSDYSKIVPIDDYYVARAVDVYMSSNVNTKIQLSKPVRMSFYIDEIDHARTSRMHTRQPLGRFRIGYWDQSKNNWLELPSRIFWNGSNGAVEAEPMQGAGRYALLWSYKADAALSPVIEEGIRIMVDLKPIQSPVAPYVKDGRTMIPLRVIAESLNVKVEWDEKESRIDLRRLNDKIQLWIGKKEALKNDQTLAFDVAPEIVDGRTFVPLRFVVEAFGAKVSWDDVTRTAKVFSN